MRFEVSAHGETHDVELEQRREGWRLCIDGRVLEVEVLARDGPFLSLLVAGRRHEVSLEPQPDGWRVAFAEGAVAVRIAEKRASASVAPRARAGSAAGEGERISAPMPGRVVRVLVAPGDPVRAGQGLVVVEAMKMENELRARRDGRVERVAVREGQAVEVGALLVVVA